MTILNFPSQQPNNPFFEDIINDGYHIFSLKNAKTPDYYPNEFPDYPGVSLDDLKIGDNITIRIFFRVGSGENIRADGGYIDLEVEEIESDKVLAVILTQLPKEFPLETGGSIEVYEEEILHKEEATDH
jgi:hypothetical protein